MSISSLIFLFFLFIQGFGFKAKAFDVAPLTGPVIDEVGILGSNQKSQIESSLFNFRNQTGIQIQVYITKSLQGEEIASAAIKIFDQWKLGDEKTDKGLLFLIAPNEKRLRIEVGQGLEGDIPDVIAKRIISDVVRPYFQKGEFAIGIAQGVSTIQNYLVSDKSQVPQSSQNLVERDSSGFWIIIIIVGFWIMLFMFNPGLALYLLFSVLRGGGGSGGGRDSWSGGGGRSSGGGASGDW